MFAVSTRTTIIGGSSAILAGALPTCSHISGAPRIKRAAPTISTAPVGRWLSPTFASRPLCDAFIEAAQRAGVPRNDDFNGATQEGAGYFQLTAKNGRRWSTAVGYLRQARRRRNLAIVSNALASRILFSGRRAVVIQYLQHSVPRTAYAEREVIVSGGAFNSPQLLQLSGLGPGKVLATSALK